MDKKLKIYISLFVLLLFGFVYMEMNKPEPINWFPTYVNSHKLPYGTYVVHQQMKSIFNKTEMEEVVINPYSFLQDSTVRGTYIFIDDAVNFGESEFDKLKEFVDRGNDVLLSTHGATIDEFKLKTDPIASVAFEQDVFITIENKELTNGKFRFERPLYNTIFTSIDSSKVEILGKTGYTNSDGVTVEEGANFIKFNYGEGNFFFHTFPEAFTNYFMLKNDNHDYVSSVLSHLNEREPILWDSYYKTGKSKVISEMHYILKNRSFKWAYRFALFGLLIFIIFEGKRKQRIVPIISPTKNQSLAFTRTIANMYYENGENKALAEHKITYFLAYVREHFQIDTLSLSEDFFKKLAVKSNQPEEEVLKLMNLILKIQQNNQITKEDLLDLNHRIDKIKK